MIKSRHFLFTFALLLALPIVSLAQPKLVKHGSTSQLIVNGKPMLMIGGEMGNSSASTLSDVQQYFPHLKQLGLNTVLVPAYWELIEPLEGKFDFSTIQNVITTARKNDLKVVFLWFGAWKNSMSCYCPEWFKTDTKRFPRAHALNGRPVEEASSLSRNVLEADKKAFCQLIQFVKDVDSKDETVIMVQVENEIGMIDVPRDYSADANKMYNGPVPEQLVKYLKTHPQHPFISEKLKDINAKSWAGMFGDDIYTEEIFQAWTYALYVEELTKAGKAIYNIPMYVNVALNSRNRKPGQYPSAGPLAHLVNIWQCGAPSVDVMGLDLYDKDYRGWTDKYHMPSTTVKGIYNPMFIPEIRLDDNDAVRALYAFGHHSAMGFCPFSIEDYPLMNRGVKNAQLSAADLAKDDQLNAFTSLNSNLSPIAASYRLLRQIEPIILEKQGTGDIYGVHLDNDLREQTITTPDGIILTVKHSYSLGWEPGSKSDNWPEAGCLIIRQGKNDYLVLGSGVVITYASKAAKAKAEKKADYAPQDGECIGLAKCEIVEYTKSADGALTPIVLRHLSGDQTHQGRHVRIPTGIFQMQHFRLYKY